MKSQQENAIEFIGGPFDGYRHQISFPASELTSAIIMPVNENVLRMLEGKRPGPKRPATSVAIYSLENEHGVLRYCYVGARCAAQFQLESWKG